MKITDIVWYRYAKRRRWEKYFRIKSCSFDGKQTTLTDGYKEITVDSNNIDQVLFFPSADQLPGVLLEYIRGYTLMAARDGDGFRFVCPRCDTLLFARVSNTLTARLKFVADCFSYGPTEVEEASSGLVCRCRREPYNWPLSFVPTLRERKTNAGSTD